MGVPQCFSSVVGPNGSGKSNVIDAMLFVFGKKAKQVCTVLCLRCGLGTRLMPAAGASLCMLTAIAWAAQLRLNKVSELIHNSEHHRNLDMAQVSVHFQEIVDTVRGHSYLAALAQWRCMLLGQQRQGGRQQASEGVQGTTRWQAALQPHVALEGW